MLIGSGVGVSIASPPDSDCPAGGLAVQEARYVWLPQAVIGVDDGLGCFSQPVAFRTSLTSPANATPLGRIYGRWATLTIGRDASI
jgi:hypothetical protein